MGWEPSNLDPSSQSPRGCLWATVHLRNRREGYHPASSSSGGGRQTGGCVCGGDLRGNKRIRDVSLVCSGPSPPHDTWSHRRKGEGQRKKKEEGKEEETRKKTKEKRKQEGNFPIFPDVPSSGGWCVLTIVVQADRCSHLRERNCMCCRLGHCGRGVWGWGRR